MERKSPSVSIIHLPPSALPRLAFSLISQYKGLARLEHAATRRSLLFFPVSSPPLPSGLALASLRLLRHLTYRGARHRIPTPARPLSPRAPRSQILQVPAGQLSLRHLVPSYPRSSTNQPQHHHTASAETHLGPSPRPSLIAHLHRPSPIAAPGHTPLASG